MPHVYLEAFGVRLDVEVEDERLLESVHRILPPGWQPLRGFPEDGHLTIRSLGDDRYTVWVDEISLAEAVSADVAIQVLDAGIRARVAFVSPDRVFVHAGVVAVDGKALLLPAQSFSGKSALVAELVAAGATYYSDEFAVLDAEGRVHPYPRLLSIRAGDARYGDLHDVESLGGVAGDGPARAAVIATTRYRPGARFAPQERPSGVGALALLTNTVPAQDRPQQALAAVGRAAEGALVLEGDRGEAHEAAVALLAALRGR